MKTASVHQRVPETVLKRLEQNKVLKAKFLNERLNQRRQAKAKKMLYFRHAERYEREYYAAKKVVQTEKLLAKRRGGVFVEPQPKLGVVMRIRGINGIPPKPRKVLQLLRLRQINNAVFVRLNKAVTQMLRLVEPYVAWGYASLSTVRKLIYKRGYARVNGKRFPISSNKMIETSLGKYGLFCVEDLVHELYTVGPHFKQANSFLWHFKLNNVRGGWRMKRRHYVEGGDYGCREDAINELIQKTI